MTVLNADSPSTLQLTCRVFICDIVARLGERAPIGLHLAAIGTPRIWVGNLGALQGRIYGVATCAVAEKALAIWSSESPDENQ